MSSPVLFRELQAAGGKKIGVATLNAPQSLNSLSLEMCTLLTDQLAQWAQDDGIAVVVLDGAGGKAFCAGGDLQGIYKGMLANSLRGRVPAGLSDPHVPQARPVLGKRNCHGGWCGPDDGGQPSRGQ
jgi:enoyl-CoA hydratase/carnithine racemase